MKRRRVLSILAGAAALPVIGHPLSAEAARWQGIALGARAQIILDHPEAEILISSAVAEIRRLENIFSLYLQSSELSRLNRSGVLEAPSLEMVELLSQCAILNARTAGAFDPTVQNLWALYARSYANGQPPRSAQIAGALALTGWEKVRYSSEQVSFDRPGVTLTLNGVAQGYIADRITRLFRASNVENVLVNTGEIAALGMAPDGSTWKIQIAGAKGRRVPLTNQAIATSAAAGTTFDDRGIIGHIFDPATGRPGGKWSSVSVVANSAALADGLSTAFLLMERGEIELARDGLEVFLSA